MRSHQSYHSSLRLRKVLSGFTSACLCCWALGLHMTTKLIFPAVAAHYRSFVSGHWFFITMTIRGETGETGESANQRPVSLSHDQSQPIRELEKRAGITSSHRFFQEIQQIFCLKILNYRDAMTFYRET